MKKLILIVLVIIVFSCNDNPIQENDTEKITISAVVKCKSGDSYIPDVGASLYLFKDFRDYVNYTYQSGTYVNKETGDVVKYTQKATANSEGYASMKVGYGQHSLVVWESAKYPGKYGQNVYLIEKGQEEIAIREIYFSP